MRALIRDFLVVALGFGLLLGAYAWARFQFSHHLPAREFGINGLAAMRSTDLVLVGSSRTRQGYDPAIFEDAGCSAFVLGYNGLSPALQPPLIRAALAAANRPEALWVIEASSHALLRSPTLQDTRLFLHLPPPEKRELLEVLDQTDPRFGLDGRISLLLRADNELLLTYPLLRPLLERASYRGGYRGKGTHELTEQQFSRLRLRTDLPADAEPSPAQIGGLRQVMQILREQKVRAVFVEPPMPGPLANTQVTLRAKQQLRELIEQAEGHYLDGASLLDQQVPAYFADTSHLSGRGRAAFTRAVLEKLLAVDPPAKCGNGNFGD